MLIKNVFYVADVEKDSLPPELLSFFNANEKWVDENLLSEDIVSIAEPLDMNGYEELSMDSKSILRILCNEAWLKNCSYIRLI